jgi:CheY-like chemotaxis protein
MNDIRQSTALNILLLSRDIRAIETLCHAAQTLAAAHIEPHCDPGLAMKKLCHAKFEGVIVDLSLEGGLDFLRTVRTLTANRSAVCFAMLVHRREQTDAFQAGANFVLERPLCFNSAARVFRASYSLMARERRRYFRCPLQVAVLVRRSDGSKFTANSVNISENGLRLSSAPTMRAGDKMNLQLLLPGSSDPLNLSGEVSWSEATGTVGIQFCGVKPHVAEELNAWLAKYIGNEAAAFENQLSMKS